MKSIVIVALLIIGAYCINVEQEFQAFMTKYGKSYSGVEYNRRLRIFEENLKLAAANQAKDSAEHGVTKFFDMTFSEFKNTMLLEDMESEALAPGCLKRGVYHPQLNMFRIPEELDYRTKEGFVTEIKDQGSCGSCWAFSTAANVEGAMAMAGKPVASLSAQQIVDCSKGCTSLIYQGKNTTVCNSGCEGGWPWTALFDLSAGNTMSKVGLVSEEDYPYEGNTQSCKNVKPKLAAHIANYTCITHEDGLDEEELARALVTYGPLSIAVNANTFSSYKKGILDSTGCSGTYVNHAVLLVGYGSENGKDFWIIKNSWGENWGEKGYIRMARGKNMCGVTYGVVTANVEIDN